MNVLYSQLRKFVIPKDERTAKIRKNILLSTFVKAGSILTSFFLVSAGLNFVGNNQVEYGIWLTLSSIVLWINYFDMGIGNGLRNMLSEALATQDFQQGKSYVSTTFVLLTAIMVVFNLLYAVLYAFDVIDWYQILRLPHEIVSVDLNHLMLVLMGIISLTFILKTIGNIYQALQMPVVNDALVLVGSLLSLIGIHLWSQVEAGNLGKLAFIFTLAPLFVYIVAYPLTFFHYKELRPSLGTVQRKWAKRLFSLGGEFFLIQLACLLLFSTSSLLITRFAGPLEATRYNIGYKYFMIITMGFTIIVTPFWSAVTEAYVRGEFAWISRSLRVVLYIWGAFTALSLLMLLIAQWFYQLWVGVYVPVSLSFALMMYVTISNWNNAFAYFINGTGQVRIQLYCALGSIALFLPLSFWWGNLYGAVGVCWAINVALLTSAIALPYQFKKLITAPIFTAK